MRHSLLVLALISIGFGSVHASTVTTQNPILFVTQVPVPYDFTTIGSVFGNHLTDMLSATRGGDLYIRYPDGTLKNLTATAGFGQPSGPQTANAIAVRDPAPHWSGTKAVFSMVIGAPTKQFEVNTYYWQLYEITGMGQGETPVITKVPNQPANFNNVNPTYGTDERIIFTSDRPRDGSPQLYPQLDEYEEAPIVSGLWSLDPATGDLFIMSHNPSGNFTPIIDSAGRVIYTRWDHLQRDQQADADAGGNTYGTFNYSSEAANATILPGAEVFPEPRSSRTDLLKGTNLNGNVFNQFFPWQITEDGTDEETLNHVGRHELYGFFVQVFNDDPNLKEFDAPSPPTANQQPDQSFLHIREDPLTPGLFYATNAPEFSTHSGGSIVSITGKMGLTADKMIVTSITDPSTSSFIDEGTTPPAKNSGHYRNPLPLTDGQLIAVHTGEARADKNIGVDDDHPQSRYDWRLYEIVTSNGNSFKTAGRPLTNGISKSVSWLSPDSPRSYSGLLWEMGPVELVARTKPARLNFPLPTPEKNVLTEEGVDEAGLRAFLKSKNLAILVSRNVTTRDAADKQQPFNLRVPGTTTQTLGAGGKIYDIVYQQYFQADQIRGLGLVNPGDKPKEGRRVLAQPLHDPAAINPINSGGPVGSVQIADDGSTAAFVPARRAMTWQLTDSAGTPVVRERYWLTFAPGEIRSCTSCHGLNTQDQSGKPTPVNEPLALHKLLQFYKAGGANGLGPGTPGDADSDGFPDALEIAYGSSPTDPNSTPFGGAPAGTIQTLKLSRFDIKLNFAKTALDQVTLGGTLNVPAGFVSNKTEVFIFTGGIAQHFFLDGKGGSKTAQTSCKLSLKAKKGQVLAQTAKFTAMFKKENLAAGFAAANLLGTADVKNQARTVQIYLLFNKTVYELDAPILYTAKKGKTGSGKLKL